VLEPSCLLVPVDGTVPLGRRVPDRGRVFRQHGRQRLLDREYDRLVVAHQAGLALHHIITGPLLMVLGSVTFKEIRRCPNVGEWVLGAGRVRQSS
jgi:hypothetical protein